MSTSRQKILSHLKKTRSASAREIARALNLSGPNVRHHLSVLCSDGRVEMTAIKNREGRGRPEKFFSLSEAAVGDNLPKLLDALLVVSGLNADVQAAARLMLDAKPFASLALSKKLALLVEKLNEMHYQSHWEAGAVGPQVVLGHCPYARVIGNHPEICKVDVALIHHALDQEVGQIKRGETILQGVCPYVFQVYSV